MVKFDGCCELFHRMYEGIPEKLFNEIYVKCIVVVFNSSKHSRDKKNTFKCMY